MKRLVIAMAFGLLFPRLLVAQDVNIDALLGDSWYGLYLNGEKSGYALMSTSKDDENRIILVQDARFRIVMEGVRQELQIYARRLYAPDGGLEAIDSHFVDPSGKKNSFDAVVRDDQLILTTSVGGVGGEVALPKPRETLADALKHERWVMDGPQVGDQIEFSVFEPMFQREITGQSQIVGMDERVLDGVPTKVYKIKMVLKEMGLESVSYVAENGTVLEDVAAGMFTMRLEPEEVAKDVKYVNDVIVSNAALVDRRIENPRDRDALRLLLRGPLSEDHVFNDERQFVADAGDHVVFEAKRIRLDDFTPARLPIENPSVAQWLEPTPFIQCDDQRLVEKAKEIVGDETDALKVSNLLCAWVYKNMRSTYSARLSNAIEVLETLEGDCTEHSILYIGLARAAGLPAREVAGVVYVDGVNPGFYFHQWAKAWVGKWIDVDPTFNQPLADVTHIKLAEGDLFTQSKLIPLIGHLQIAYILEVKESELEPEPAPEPEPEPEPPAAEAPTPEPQEAEPPAGGAASGDDAS
ncbi:MAG TPA: transglutaminase family protein [Candidatus Hydrogenedentes bacterium]|nr:transglutaminase family protein [Candidatus Hydrogenedentota bacterium]